MHKSNDHLAPHDGQQVQAPALSYRAVAKGYAVSCGGRVVGLIRLTLGGGYRYFPAGVKRHGGATFATLAECKRSLES